MSKRLEHGFKALLADARTISAVDPRQYSRRFQEFMQSVFTAA
jgi:1-phosphatidylinositol-4-phosphate 5-kinase